MTTYWDEHMEYLKNSRKRWFNPDYMEFLIQKVWKINRPVRVADFACGLGYMGEMMMPNLPKGSTYTGFDNADELLAKARKDFQEKPYPAEFVHCDLITDSIQGEYDLVVCQTLLCHLQEPEKILLKMKDTVVDGGLVICIDHDWNVCNAGMYIEGLDLAGNCNLGVLAKLWKKQRSDTGVDKCIGTRLPAMLQKAGFRNVNIRLNDCARFANPYGDPLEYKEQLTTFLADGWGKDLGEEQPFVEQLMERGVTEEEARLQYVVEKRMNEYVREQGERLMVLTLPPLFIAFGTK